eukprot:g10170.t1
MEADWPLHGVSEELDKLQMLQIREMNKGKVPERTQMTGPKHLRIYPPIKVANRWRKGQKDAGHHVVAEKPQSIDKESRKWMDCQQKLFEESPDFKTKALQDQEKKAEKTCKSQLDFIRHLWEKPTSRTDLTEYTLRQLRKEIEVEYVRTLHALNMSGSGDGPQMEKLMWVKTDVDIKKKLLKFEEDELLWILQQQPLYMARLSAALRKNNVQDSEHQIFRKMCQRIFHDLFQPRTLHLCKSTLQLIAQSEVEQARNISELFHPAKSHATFLITQLATHAAFVDGIAFPILNPEDETSLVSMIIKYTMMKKEPSHETAAWPPRHSGAPAPCPARCGRRSPSRRRTSEQDLNVVTGVFVTHWFEYQELVQKAFADRPAPPGSEKNRYLNFQTELLAFQRSCDVYAGCIPKFIRNFVRQIFEDERAKDFKMLLVSCFKALRASPAAKGIEQSDPKFCTPIASIVLANILASVLEAAQTPHFSLVVLKIRKKVHKQVFQTQFQTKPDQVLKEEPESRQICDEIKEFPVENARKRDTGSATTAARCALRPAWQDFTCQILHEQFSQIRAGGWSEEMLCTLPLRQSGSWPMARPMAHYRKVVRGLSPLVHFHDRNCLWWDPLWSLGLPSLLCSFWSDPWTGLFVAGALRWALVQHITFAVNSVAHGTLRHDDVYSFDPAADGVGPRVSLAVTLFSLGEGWHDYHHLFPWDYAAAAPWPPP